MKKNRIVSMLSAAILASLLVSCENRPIEFPDYDYSTVYFAYQYPVRTIVLGEDIIDNTLDNEHKCMVFATMGGVYANKQLVDIDIEVADYLCNNLFFTRGGSPVLPMPSNYYSLSASRITLDNSLLGGVEVQLTDAFFADTLSLVNSYVIPLVMTGVVNADSILSGDPKFDGALRCRADDWEVVPKDYTLYCVKFINPWHGNYLRRGEDLVTEGGSGTTVIRHEEYVEYDELCSMKTASMNSVEFPVTVKDTSDTNVKCTLLLTFDANDNCTVTAAGSGFTASGSGSFVVDGDKDSWGNQDRNVIYLDYTLSLPGKSFVTKDTLVVRDRDVSMETFTPVWEVI